MSLESLIYCVAKTHSQFSSINEYIFFCRDISCKKTACFLRTIRLQQQQKMSRLEYEYEQE